jgi:YD repeat-containing protein
VPGEAAAVTTHAYDDSANLATVTDAKGHITSQTWNAIGKPLKWGLNGVLSD